MFADGKISISMNQETRQLWQWVFGHFNHISEPPAFNPAKADAVFKRHAGSVLFLTAIRNRGLWLRKYAGYRKASAMTAVMEVAQ